MPRFFRSRWEKIGSLAILTLLPFLWFAPMLARGEVPWTVDPIFFLPPWEEARPPDLIAPRQPDHEAIALRYLPWYAFLTESMREGESLLWNPYDSTGMPFLALWETRCLSPFSVPFYFLPLAAAIACSVLLKLIVSGYCAYYAARRFTLGAPIALAVGVAYQCSAYAVLWSAWPVSDVAPWFPLLLVVADHVSMGTPGYVVRGALVWALMLLGGSPEACLVAIAYLLGFVLLRHAYDRRPWGQLADGLLRFLVCMGLGLGLAAAQIVPAIEYFLASTPASADALGLASLADLVLAIFPHFYASDPAAYPEAATALHANRAAIFYSGFVCLPLTALWLALRRFVIAPQRRRLEAMALAAVCLTAIALSIGAVQRDNSMLARFGLEHFLFVNAFVFPLLAAAAAEEWVALDPEECGATIRRLFFTGALVFVVCGGVVAFAIARTGVAPESLLFQFLVAAGLTLAVAVLLLATLFRPNLTLTGYALAGLVAADLWLAFMPLQRYASPDTLFPETTFVASLKEKGDRVCGSAALGQWPLLANRLPQVMGSSGAQLERHAAFVSRLKDSPLLVRQSGTRSLLLTKDDIQGPFADVRAHLRISNVFASGAVFFEDLSTSSRARMVYAVRAVPEFAPDLLDAALPPIVERPNPIEPAPGPEGVATLAVPEHHTELAVEVSETRPGILVLADAWYPGWKAYIDGTPAEISPVDGLFRGVAIPQGAHTVRFVYDPLSWKAGLGLSALSAMTLLALTVKTGYRRRRS